MTQTTLSLEEKTNREWQTWRDPSWMPTLVENLLFLPSIGPDLSLHTNIYMKVMALTWIPRLLHHSTINLHTLRLNTNQGSRFNRENLIFQTNIVRSDKRRHIEAFLMIKTASLHCAPMHTCAIPKVNSLSRVSSTTKTTNRGESKIVDPNTTTTSKTRSFLLMRRSTFLRLGAESVCLVILHY